MIPAEEARFIALWTAGTTTAAMAQQLGIPRGTVASRAYALVRQGKIAARPKGGAYPMPRRQRRQEETPATPAPQVPPAPPVTPAPPAPPATPAPPAMTFVAVPEIQDMLSLMKDLHARVIALEQTRVPPALPAPPAAPATPAVDRKDIQQWTVRLSKALIERLKAVAYERRIPPSQLVEELIRKSLIDHHPSTPSSASTPDRTSSGNP
jgi:hypothetical protein